MSPDSVNVGDVVSAGGASGSTTTGGAMTTPPPPPQAVASSTKNSAEIKEKLEVKRYYGLSNLRSLLTMAYL